MYSNFNYIHLVGDPGEDPGHTGGIISPSWPGNASGSPRMSWRMLRMRGKPRWTCWVCCHGNQTSDKRLKMDGWIDLSTTTHGHTPSAIQPSSNSSSSHDTMIKCSTILEARDLNDIKQWIKNIIETQVNRM